jgi:hypothetical protein
MYCRYFYELLNIYCKLALINNNIYSNRYYIKTLDCRALNVLLVQGPSKLLRRPWLLAVHLLLNVDVKGDVELMGWPSVHRHKRQHGACGFNHGGECLAKVNARPLIEPSDDPTSFVLLEGVVRVQLACEDPFAGDDAGSRWTRDERVSMSCCLARHRIHVACMAAYQFLSLLAAWTESRTLARLSRMPSSCTLG